jgi:hypothetical protein
VEHRILPESLDPAESISVAVAGAAFHSVQICAGKGVAEMRPLSIQSVLDGDTRRLNSACIM